MKFVDNWTAVLRGSWSIWMVLCGLLCMGASFLALLTPDALGLSPVPFAVASSFFNTVAIPARLIMQSSLGAKIAEFRADTSGAVRTRTVGVIAASGIAMTTAVAFIGDWEGLRTEAYQDIVGVWTVCYGETKGVQSGDSYTKAECDAMLAQEVVAYEAALDRCLTANVPVGMKIALVSWTYNVGAAAACKSTLVRKANAQSLRGACHELPRWNRAGGRVIRGLSNRRTSERQLCLKALEAIAA